MLYCPIRNNIRKEYQTKKYNPKEKQIYKISTNKKFYKENS